MSEGAGRARWGIDELAHRAGLPVGTVRLYLRDGLVPSGRRVGRSMTYGVSHLNRLIRIRQLKAANFTLTAIKRMIDEGQFVMLDRVFGTDRRPRTGQELAEEVGVEPELVDMLEAIGFLADPADRGGGRVRRRRGECGAGRRPAHRHGDATGGAVSGAAPLRAPHAGPRGGPDRGALRGRDRRHDLPPEVVAAYAERTARNHEAFLYRWDVVVDYLHHRMIQRLVHRAAGARARRRIRQPAEADPGRGAARAHGMRVSWSGAAKIRWGS